MQALPLKYFEACVMQNSGNGISYLRMEPSCLKAVTAQLFSLFQLNAMGGGGLGMNNKALGRHFACSRTVCLFKSTPFSVTTCLGCGEERKQA